MAASASFKDGVVCGFQTIEEKDSISCSVENVAPLSLPAEAFSFCPNAESVLYQFKNGDSERKIYCNVNLLAAEKTQLKNLQQAVRAANLKLLPSIAVMATRFLSRARGDAHKAIKLMKDTQEWRAQYFKDGPLDDKELAPDIGHGVIYFSGRDKNYRPVIIVRGKRIPEKWIKEKRTDLLIRVLVFCMEYMIRYMLIPGKVENLNVIFDFKGVSIGFSDIARLKEVYRVMSHHYLGRVFKFYICNLSPGLKTLTSMATALLTDRQKQKLCFLDNVLELRQDFALHQLEEDLGGSRPLETKFYPFNLPSGPFTAGFDGGSDGTSVVNGHVLLSKRGFRGGLWDDAMSREDNLALDYADGAFEHFKKFDLPIPPECVKTRAMQAWYNIRVLSGVKGGGAYLSSSQDATRIQLTPPDDEAGKQRWALTQGDGDWYHIQRIGSLPGAATYLSAHQNGSLVDFYDHDDGSGRQRWILAKGDENGTWYTIQAASGISCDRTYLSTHADGHKLDLWSSDDESGRQRWTLVPPGTADDLEEIISI